MTESSARVAAERLTDRLRHRRPIDGCSAVLLPYSAEKAIDWDSFGAVLSRTHDAGLTPAINMDTSFGPLLSADERSAVLRFASGALPPGAALIAGAGVFGMGGDPLGNYRASIGEIAAADATPIVFQSDWLSSRRDADLAQAYREVLADAPRAIAFELGTMFAPFGRIYSLSEFERLLEIEALVGAKHSSLDRVLELERLQLRDALRPDFKVYTGNDLAIDMVMYGSDYLLGLSAFDPDAFALRDRWWAEGDARFFGLNDALQALGAVAFREPVPAYKDSLCRYLLLDGRLPPGASVHPDCPTRPAWEVEILAPLRDRIASASGR